MGLNVALRVEQLQLQSTRATMAFLKASVVKPTKRDLSVLAKVVDRACDSRSCANMIKEGYQAVKKVLIKTSRLRPNRNEVWPLTDDTLANTAEHRDMVPALLLMVVGFENLSSMYHTKVGVGCCW